MKERSKPRFYVDEDIPELTVKLATISKVCKTSKFVNDKLEEDLRPAADEDGSEADFDMMSMMSEDVDAFDKSYGYGNVGMRMQKRIPLKMPYEEMLQKHMVKLKSRIEKKIRLYTRNGN